MPIVQQKSNQLLQYILWKNEIDGLSLHPKDAEGLLAVQHPQKKIEYSNSRFCLKTLCENVCIRYAGIVKDENGKPFLMNYPDVSIAISHIKTHVATVVALQKDVVVGIDLEQISDKIVKIAPRVLHPKELDYARQNAVQLTIIWSAKETLYKLQGRKGITFHSQLFIHPFQLARSGQLLGEMHLDTRSYWVELAYEVYSNFVLTYAALRLS
jgi:4'-phosphopantetheinyl transferase EntD